MIFAEQLKKLRKKSGLSQKEFAERVGVHMQSVSKWERGVMLPDISALDSIASALSVSVDELLGFPAPAAVASGFFDAQAFGKRLAQARRDKEKTQIEIESELGFSSGSLSRWESGQFCPDAEQLMLLCEALSVSPQALYFSPSPSPAAAKAEQTETERKNTGANNAGKIGSGKRKLWIFGAIAAAVIAVAGATAGITGAALAQRSSSANASSHHEWGVWEVISEPTCESAGVEVRYDENDPSAEPETRPIAALGHDWEQISVVPPTCTQNGFTLYECRNCHKTQSMDQTYFYGHDWKVVETVLPTCGEMGYTEYVCDHCHTTEKRDYTATVGHDWKVVEKTEPTCETTGYTVFECEFCHVKEKRDYVPAVSHDFVAVETVSPTCEEMGYTLCECEFCHVKEKRDYVSSVAHKYKEVSVVPPTCEEMGYTLCECEFCHVKEKRDYVPAVSHEFVAVETVAPTCEEMGYTVFECKYCHSSEERAHVAALGHDWGYPFVFKAASCTEEGVSRRVCNRDASHHTDSVIAKKAHEYDDETGKCANCGDVAKYLLSEKSFFGKYKLLKWFESADVIDLSVIEHASELTEIAAGAFDGVTANKLIISDSVNRLDGEMFEGSQIKEIVLGKNVGSIVCRSRVNYPAITRITTNPDNPRYYTFGDGLVVYVNPNTGLGGLEFSPQDLTDVVIKDEWNVYMLLNGTFAPSEKLRTLVLPDTLKGVTSTHDFTAAKYPNLQRNIYEGVAYLPSSTNPYFAAVEIVDKTMATLSFHPDCKFNLIQSMENCNFSTMHFLSGLKLSYEQFMTIPTPLTVYYEGTKEEWESLEGVSYAIRNNLSVLEDITVFYYSESYAEGDYFWHYVDGERVLWNGATFENGMFLSKNAYYKPSSDNAFATLVELKDKTVATVELNPAVSDIRANAFGGCSSLTSITFPASVTQINTDLCKGCSSLKSVEFVGTSYVNVVDGADGLFADSHIETYKGPANVLGWVVDINSLKYVETTGEMHTCFSTGSKIETLVIGESESTRFAEGQFNCCSNLKRVVLPANLTSIENMLFAYCSSLTDIEIPASVTEIGEFAFDGCESLTEIFIPVSVTEIGRCAFYQCPSLTIRCAASSKPDGWADDWNHGCTVVWSCSE